MGWFYDKQVRSLLSNWIDEWSDMGRGAWLRSLRPPMFGLDAPILEEYRGVDSHFLPWKAEVLRSTASTNYKIDHNAHAFGSLALRDAHGNCYTMRIDDDSSFRCVVTLSCGDAIAGGWLYDYEGTVVRVNPRTNELIWRIELSDEIDHITKTIGGEGSIILTHPRGHTLIDCQTGAIVTKFPHDTGIATISPNGEELAVFQGGTLRVWSLRGQINWNNAAISGGRHRRSIFPKWPFTSLRRSVI